jgi:predicted nucleotidyltransferase component of viral defense system
MTKGKPRNLTASVHDRLLDLARKQKEEFQLLLTRYCLERLLYRLSRSPHRNLFILKGAMLFAVWSNDRHRPTRDLDLLAKGQSSIERFEQIFREVCGQAVEEDGLEFQSDTVRGERIKEDADYEGVRMQFEVRLGSARITLQVDLGFGDVVTPAAAEVTYPTLLAFPAPTLLAYPKETVVAEKFQAMVLLGTANSRMKDFYDLLILSQRFGFDGPSLCGALRATFKRRETALPGEPPVALTEGFSSDQNKLRQWQAFLRKSKGEANDLGQVVQALRLFLMPPAQAAAQGETFAWSWPAGGPWAPSPRT